MEYRELAEQLVDLQTQLRLAPVSKQLSALDKGMFLALYYLMVPHASLHPKELSKKMAVSSARVAALLNHLEQEGLIVRKPDPEDNRQIIVSLTAQGEQLIKSKKTEVVDSLTEALKELDPEEAQTYLRLQMKLLKNLLRQR